MQEKSLEFLEKILLKKIYWSNSSWGYIGATVSSLYTDISFFYSSLSLLYIFKNTLKLAVWGKLSILTSTTLPWKSSLTLFKGNAWKEVKPAQQTPGNPSVYEWFLFHTRDTATPAASGHRAQPQQILLSMFQCSGTEEKLFPASSLGSNAVWRSCFQKVARLPLKDSTGHTCLENKAFPQRESQVLYPESSHTQLSFPGS